VSVYNIKNIKVIMNKILIYILLLKQILSVSIEDLYLDQPQDIYDLTESLLHKFTSKHAFTLILFYNSKDPKSSIEFEKASKQSYLLGVRFGRIDIADIKLIAHDWGVKQVPAVYWVSTVDDKELVNTYNYIGYIKRKFGISTIEEVRSLKELLDKNITNENYLIVITSNLNNTEEYVDKVNLLDNAIERCGFKYIFVTDSEEVKGHLGIPNVFTVISKLYTNGTLNSELIQFKDDDFKSEENLIKVLENYSQPSFQELSKDLMAQIVQGKPSLLLIYGQETGEEDLEKAKEVLEQLSKKYRRHLLFSATHFDNLAVDIVKEVYKVQHKHLPYLLLTNARKNSTSEMDKFKIENARLDINKVDQFLTNWLEGKLEQFLISEDVSDTPDERGIFKIASSNIEQFLNQTEKNIVLLICTANRNCREFANRYLRIVSAFKTKLLFAETDPNNNEYEIDIVHKYPSLLLFKASEGSINYRTRFSNAIKYNGDLTSLNVVKWIIRETDSKGVDVPSYEDEGMIIPSDDFNIDDLLFNSSGDLDLDKVYQLEGETVLDEEFERTNVDSDGIINRDRDL
jgi:thiol-disulfide isomerase/thioredoxin